MKSPRDIDTSTIHALTNVFGAKCTLTTDKRRERLETFHEPLRECSVSRDWLTYEENLHIEGGSYPNPSDIWVAPAGGLQEFPAPRVGGIWHRNMAFGVRQEGGRAYIPIPSSRAD